MLNIFKKLLRKSKGSHQASAKDTQTEKPYHEMPALRIAELEIGEGWASNTINTTIFRHHAILTMNGAQYTAFYVNTTTLRIIKRDLATDRLESHDISGTFNLHDAHNGVSLGHDRKGRLHITYDHHASRLQYRISRKPHTINDWTESRSMTDAHEDNVTYPSFILPRMDFPLTFLYRDGSWNKGKARLKYFDEQTDSWSDLKEPVLSGADLRPWTANAYWNHPCVGRDGSLHISYVWRTHSLPPNQLINNINVCYAKSMDNGVTWFTSKGLQYQTPITPVNSEVICAISPGSNLINQCGMALDSNNLPHIVFYANDKNNIPQYQHLWFDGITWHAQIISSRLESFSLQGGGTLEIPISRPDIIIGDNNDAHVIFRGDLTGDRMAILSLESPDYKYDSSRIALIDPEPLGRSEPIIDRSRWSTEGILSILIQRCQQPNHDEPKAETLSSIRVLDLKLRNKS